MSSRTWVMVAGVPSRGVSATQDSDPVPATSVRNWNRWGAGVSWVWSAAAKPSWVWSAAANPSLRDRCAAGPGTTGTDQRRGEVLGRPTVQQVGSGEYIRRTDTSFVSIIDADLIVNVADPLTGRTLDVRVCAADGSTVEAMISGYLHE